MASILKVDTIQDQAGNNIISEAANVITIGASGDTITVPAGATVSGFTSAGIDDNATSVAITIDSSERVGIGSTAPDHLLHISASSSNAQLKLQRTGSATATYNISASSDALAFSDQVAGSERMRINSTGLGIGTSAPSAGLEVSNSNGIKISRSGFSQYMQLYPANNNVPTILGVGGNGIHIGTTTTTGIHVDGSDNVLINTTSASGFDSAGLPLIVGSGSTHQGITIFSGTSHQGAIHFADGTGTSSYRGQLNYKHDLDAMTFATSGGEKARILNNTFMVGKTSASGATNGVELKTNDESRFTQTARTVVAINRLSSDGNIVEFKKDNTTIGAITARSGDMSIHSTTSNHSGLRFGFDSIFATSSSGAENDNVCDFGSPNLRFKNIYLGGGAFLGGTGSSNKLDDYEEGTWTPVSTFANDTASGQAGAYTKVGNMVVATFQIVFSTTSFGVNTGLSGLPFTSNSTTGNASGATVGFYNGSSTTLQLYLPENATQLNLRDIDGDIQHSGTKVNGKTLRGVVVYRTA